MFSKARTVFRNWTLSTQIALGPGVAIKLLTTASLIMPFSAALRLFR
jgi:hypothetical protein